MINEQKGVSKKLIAGFLKAIFHNILCVAKKVNMQGI